MSSFPLFYGISNRRLFPQLSISQYLRSLIGSSAHIIQWREKDLSVNQSLTFIREGVGLARPQEKLFLVNSLLEAALHEQADGVHLPGDQSVAEAVSYRARSGRANFLIGKSVHSLEEGIVAEREGADYILLSPIFVPLSKTSSIPPLGLRRLTQAVNAIQIPIFALGGIDESRFSDVFQTGAAGVAGVSWVHTEIASRLDRASG